MYLVPKRQESPFFTLQEEKGSVVSLTNYLERRSITRMNQHRRQREGSQKDKEIIRKWESHLRLQRQTFKIVKFHIFNKESKSFLSEIRYLITSMITKEVEYSQEIDNTYKKLVKAIQQISEFIADISIEYYGLHCLKKCKTIEVNRVIEFFLLRHFFLEETFKHKLRETSLFMICRCQKRICSSKQTIIRVIQGTLMDCRARRMNQNKLNDGSSSFMSNVRFTHNEVDIFNNDSSLLKGIRRNSPKMLISTYHPGSDASAKKNISSKERYKILTSAVQETKKEGLYKKLKAKYFPKEKEDRCPFGIFGYLINIDYTLRNQENENNSEIAYGFFKYYLKDMIEYLHLINLIFPKKVIKRKLPLLEAIRSLLIDYDHFIIAH